jgi:hypothetical protein
MDYNKRFSIAHFDRFHGEFADTFYHIIKNSAQTYKDNIHDIYFGKYYYYEYNGVQKRLGNPMGVEASDEQIDYLFKLQEEFGIEISLTINTLEFPHEVVFDPKCRMDFVKWIGSYYDRGLRSCTISSTHIMRTGELQARCPDMRWKSTVNQICADAQQFIDFAYLGYNTILLDRSLNRNIKELRRIKRAQDYLNSLNPKKKVLTSLLIAESCIYSCPFKKEHDSVGEVVSTQYFSGPADLTCNGWRGSEKFKQLPRAGIDLVASTSDSMKMWMELVDIMKLSGRLTIPKFALEDKQYMRAAWFYTGGERFRQVVSFGAPVYADDYKEIMDNNLAPIHEWIPGWIDTRYSKKDWRSTYKPYDGIWSKPEGKKLEKLLTSCRNQCWDCHECERTFGFEDIDSALQLRKRTDAS